MLCLTYGAVTPLGTHGVTIHIWFVSPLVVLLQAVVLHLRPFPCPVLSHSIRKVKSQPGKSYKIGWCMN